jgi:hypothetical protein
MRTYEEFAAALRREIEDADLGRGEADFRLLEAQAPARPRAAARLSPGLRLALSAALAVALGIGGWAAYESYDSRRLLAQNNSEFVESLLSRGLFEAGAPPTGFEGLAEGTLFDAGGSAPQASGSGWLDSGIAD